MFPLVKTRLLKSRRDLQSYYMKHVKLFISTVPLDTVQHLLLDIGNGRVFGEHTLVEVRLYDRPEQERDIQIMIAQFMLASYPWLKDVRLFKDLEQAFKDADYLLFIPRPSKEDIDFKEFMKEQLNFLATMAVGFDKYAKLTARGVVWSKYPSLTCHMMSAFLHEIPWNQLSAVTRHLQTQATTFIAEYLKIRAFQVRGVMIFGEKTVDANMGFANLEEEVFAKYKVEDLKDMQDGSYELATFKRGKTTETMKKDAQRIQHLYETSRQVDHSKCIQCQNVQQSLKDNIMMKQQLLQWEQEKAKVKKANKYTSTKPIKGLLSLGQIKEIMKVCNEKNQNISMSAPTGTKEPEGGVKMKNKYTSTIPLHALLTKDKSQQSRLKSKLSEAARSTTDAVHAKSEESWAQTYDQDEYPIFKTEDEEIRYTKPRKIYDQGFDFRDDWKPEDFITNSDNASTRQYILRWLLEKKIEKRSRENYFYDEDGHLNNLVMIIAAVNNKKWYYDTLPKMVQNLTINHGMATAGSLGEHLRLLHEGTNKPFSIMTCSMGAFGFPKRMFLSAPGKVHLESKEIVYWQDYTMDERVSVSLMREIMQIKMYYDVFDDLFLKERPKPQLGQPKKPPVVKEYVRATKPKKKIPKKQKDESIEDGGDVIETE